ncbi:MAG: sodium:calcium antiporter [Anaerolineaceae bacterium]|nr:sodium:calcium antiporter [Anaerolineaceae bacterium]MBN2677319.1 sodium:calcium antiporter [Anaerolineaceae bacterium]
MVWVQFILTAVVIVIAANFLAKYGDVIAVRTKLGGMFVGTLLLAGVTSLPELLTTVSAIREGVPDLAAGNLLGSNMFNMLLLAVLDLVHIKQRLLRKAAFKHALSGGLAMFMIGLAVFFIMAEIDIKIGWVGVDSLVLLLVYVAGIRLLQTNPLAGERHSTVPVELPEGVPSLRQALIGFGIASLALIFTTPLMVSSSVQIAEITGLGTTFIGTTLVALVTSLPEMVTTISAAKYGADDMAIGNLFGSNLFNMAALGLTDFFYPAGRFLGAVDPAFVLVGLLGLIMTGMGLIGNLARLERRIGFIEVDALLLILTFFGGFWFLYIQGISP